MSIQSLVSCYLVMLVAYPNIYVSWRRNLDSSLSPLSEKPVILPDKFWLPGVNWKHLLSSEHPNWACCAKFLNLTPEISSITSTHAVTAQITRNWSSLLIQVFVNEQVQKSVRFHKCTRGCTRGVICDTQSHAIFISSSLVGFINVLGNVLCSWRPITDEFSD